MFDQHGSDRADQRTNQCSEEWGENIRQGRSRRTYSAFACRVSRIATLDSLDVTPLLRANAIAATAVDDAALVAI